VVDAAMPHIDRAHHPLRRTSDVLVAISMVLGRGRAARIVADLAGLTCQDRVVDIGCGPGTATRVAGFDNVRIPVKDAWVSRDWYMLVFGFVPLLDLEEELGLVGVVTLRCFRTTGGRTPPIR
jgi:SAM-dependent methyltransferase